MVLLGYLVIAVAAYLLGSVPTGFLVARMRGVDLRTVGSGNIGATNAFRALGKTAGIVVLVVDALKGFVACTGWCTVGLWLLGRAGVPLGEPSGYRLLSGLAAVLGHNYTCWLRFKGGKGVATSAGVFAALAPLALLIALATWLVAFALTRYVSVGSLAAAVVLPGAVWLTQNDRLLAVVTTALGALAIARHHTNIRRLLRGTEHRIGFKPRPPTA